MDAVHACHDELKAFQDIVCSIVCLDYALNGIVCQEGCREAVLGLISQFSPPYSSAEAPNCLSQYLFKMFRPLIRLEMSLESSPYSAARLGSLRGLSPNTLVAAHLNSCSVQL